ncbi:MAG: hypothetical protein IT239_05475 [Bacteroidia bacterium]|nr:hypothetical protein [Bacteroidia bacterium]
MTNTFKKIQEPEKSVDDVKEKVLEKETSKPIAKPIGAVLSVVGGSFLTREYFLKQIPFVLFWALLAMMYIANGYYAEHTVKEINLISNQLKELRSEYITTKSDLMHLSKQSEVARIAAKYNLKESITPPKKIVLE